ncbi:MAG: hypothetical protein NZL83_02580 [Candidatus Absconditabacterales bacterium]|nr:hypothetical protein [Candidatus Absconditabacterales bacterium]
MVIFYEIIKALFFGLSLFIGLFMLRSEYFGMGGTTGQMQDILMPGYLIFCGIMIGYVLSTIWSGYATTDDEEKAVYIKGFIIGTVIGITLSLAYIAL